MMLSEFFAQVVNRLDKKKVKYALAGGLVASIYRQSARATQDIDLAIFSHEASEVIAKEIIKSFGLKFHLLRKADLEGGPMFAIKKRSTPVWIIAGRGDTDQNSETRIGLDFIMPAVPWVLHAIERAQYNKIDFGFARVPCLTIEDFIISKFFSLKNQQTRFMDLDDLREVFIAKHQLELEYICEQMIDLKLRVPEPVRDFAPAILNSVDLN